MGGQQQAWECGDAVGNAGSYNVSGVAWVPPSFSVVFLEMLRKCLFQTTVSVNLSGREHIHGYVLVLQVLRCVLWLPQQN